MKKITIENEKRSINPDLEIVIKNYYGIGEGQYNKIPLNAFRYHHLIYGGYKQPLSLLQDILKQFYTNVPTLGQLIIRTSHHSNMDVWTYDKRYDLGSLMFPYHSGYNLKGSTNETMLNFIIGLFGFWDEMIYPLTITLKEKEDLEFPPSHIELLNALKQNLKTYPYCTKRNMQECRKIDQGIAFLHSQPQLHQALSKPRKINSIRWIEEWKNGDTLYIDLTNENRQMQSIIITAMCNYMCQVVPHSNAQIPSGIIIFDEFPYYTLEGQLTKCFVKIVRDQLRFRYIGILSPALTPNVIILSFPSAFHEIVNYRDDGI